MKANAEGLDVKAFTHVNKTSVARNSKTECKKQSDTIQAKDSV